MEIKCYNKKDLTKLISCNIFWKKYNLPITKYRALSYINNPRADKDDILLIIAYEKDSIIGYIGVVPDLIIVNGKEYKVGILSTWWVHPGKIKSGIGAILLLKPFNLYNNSLFVSGFTRKAEHVFRKLNKFYSIKSSYGLELYKSFNFNRNVKSSIIKKYLPPQIKQLISSMINKYLVHFQNLFLHRLKYYYLMIYQPLNQSSLLQDIYL